MGQGFAGQPEDIRERTFRFAVRIVKFCEYLSKRPDVNRRLVSQLFGAGTSVGANTEESAAADSRRHFIAIRAIALRECREAVYWLRLLAAAQLVEPALVADLIDEGEQITRILARANITAKQKPAPKT